MTNRDLYLALTALPKSPSFNDSRDLETFLRALLPLARECATDPAISAEQFLDLLKRACSAEPLFYDPEWEAASNITHDLKLEGYPRFLATLTRQIVDLHEMRIAGMLENKYRYFGIDAPRGGRWFNFDPAGFLECATVGALGGWEPEDSTGRSFVPGPVAAVDDLGHLSTANPEDIPRPRFEISHITWDQFTDFLWCGQIYE